MSIQFPAVNLNGTDASDLLEQLHNAHTKICDAISAVASATPHGRDYQTLDASAFNRALAEHSERLRTLVRIAGEYNLIIESVFSQQQERESRKGNRG